MNRVIIVLIAAGTILAGCSRPGIKGDGVIKTEDRSVSDFSKVVATGGYQIKWSSGKPALSISTDQNLLPLIETVVSDNTLQIKSTEDLVPTTGVTIVVSSASLTDLRLTGGIRFKGSRIIGHDLKLDSSGAADISVDGSVTNLEANLNGASKLDAKSLQTQKSIISLVGASEAGVTVSDTLNASVTGVGLLTYSGNPRTVEKSVNGAGRIQRQP